MKLKVVYLTSKVKILITVFLVHLDIRVTAVAGQYQIGIYSVRPIVYGEEVTFDYNSVTEVSVYIIKLKKYMFVQMMMRYLRLILIQSKEEYEASVCLCGSQVCRGSFLNLTGEGAFQKVSLTPFIYEWVNLGYIIS